MADLAVARGAVVLGVGLRLGSLNQARLAPLAIGFVDVPSAPRNLSSLLLENAAARLAAGC